MSGRIIAALFAKDLLLFFRNRFFAVITLLGLAAYVAIYLVLPSTVEEELSLALYAPVVPPIFEVLQEEGLQFESFGTEEELRSAVAEGDYPAGIALSDDVLSQLAEGQSIPVHIYLAGTTPPEIREAVPILVEEFFLMQMGQPLGVEFTQETIGQDRLGIQIPPRDRMVPLFAVIMLITEMLGLASLIAEEIAGRTSRH
jgi:ABC-2 type transport system permease protein